MNTLEAAVFSAKRQEGKLFVSLESVKLLTQKTGMRYDRDADEHYDILSAFHKSLRGSDENAALHYLARLLEAGDIISPARRLLACVSEDVGMAYPMAAAIVKSLVDSAFQLGLPEAKLPLAQAVIVIATAPKSNSVCVAVEEAIADVQKGKAGPIPAYLRDGHYPAPWLDRGEGYWYPHLFPQHYVKKQYLPDSLKNAVYYRPGENKNERQLSDFQKKIKEP